MGTISCTNSWKYDMWVIQPLRTYIAENRKHWPPLITEGYAVGMVAVSRELLHQLPQSQYAAVLDELHRQFWYPYTHDLGIFSWMYMFEEPTAEPQRGWQASASV